MAKHQTETDLSRALVNDDRPEEPRGQETDGHPVNPRTIGGRTEKGVRAVPLPAHDTMPGPWQPARAPEPQLGALGPQPQSEPESLEPQPRTVLIQSAPASGSPSAGRRWARVALLAVSAPALLALVLHVATRGGNAQTKDDRSTALGDESAARTASESSTAAAAATATATASTDASASATATVAQAPTEGPTSSASESSGTAPTDTASSDASSPATTARRPSSASAKRTPTASVSVQPTGDYDPSQWKFKKGK